MKAKTFSTFIFLLLASYAQAIKEPINFYPLKMATKPKCVNLASKGFGNFNSGIDLTTIKIIYAFGDSYMANGQSIGGTPPSSECSKNDGDNPKCGGRASNGPVYPEQFAKYIDATLKDYAQGGATVSHLLWPSDKPQTDMIEHVQTFIDQHNIIDPSSTLAIISYGINDWASTYRLGTGNLLKAAQELIDQTDRIFKAGIRKIVILSPPMISNPLQSFNDKIWNDLKFLKTQYTDLQIGYVDFTALYSAIKANPHSFGYESTGSCLKSQTSIAAGKCSTPAVYLYWIPDHPQKLTHGLMAEWTYEALTTCTAQKVSSQ
ncbi:hypothetical protein CROQUDRAFT_720837 [Cronartium quercuum f. sp. fusiforme G11]|uniref:SGNH hydrolase-type esterase domain-containing protein n=1 Tax=Cronartium quercuum f. sp. fusiforme G11 TaxID=708437 RepID=A0A9P6NUB1_9BASI|nr:hypothetical protein CROQUDRAFT_720837 [Cronartium quercuum f. sp. fusiforme G11]